MNKRQKIQEKINKEYAKLAKEMEPLRKELRKIDSTKSKNGLKKHKGLIYKKKYGKDYTVLKVINGIDKKGFYVYNEIVIRSETETSLSYLTKGKRISKEEAINFIKEKLGGNAHEN